MCTWKDFDRQDTDREQIRKICDVVSESPFPDHKLLLQIVLTEHHITYSAKLKREHIMEN